MVLKAVLFDLDGTLLRINTGHFMNEYLKEVGAAVAPHVDPGPFIVGLMASTSVMMANKDTSATNSEVFWEDFTRRMGDSIEIVKPVIEDFYANRFGSLSRVVQPGDWSRKAVLAALGRGLRIGVATQPVFPLSAVRQRMSWAGVDDLPWDFVASYEELHFCKPNPDYFREIAERLGLSPEECLMVGNDVEEDLAAASTGMRTGLVTDFLVNAQNKEYSTDWSGTLAELPGWLAEYRNGL